ncbi:Imm1 family immunity protein [Actinokineospora sp.]|uniref:Imm1 family immunity protein n=1 Tax=Actinokineospora sp. TaxID=1872133 RepID=UPI00403822AE
MQHPRPLFVAVRGDVGYVGPVDGYSHVAKMWPAGDPASPTTHGTNNVEYPAGSGLPLTVLARVLDEFRETAKLPESVRWIADEVTG